MKAKTNTKVSVNAEKELEVTLNKKGEKQSTDLKKAMNSAPHAKQSKASQVESKYLDKKQLDHAFTVLKTRLVKLEANQSAVVLSAIAVGEQLLAIQHGMKKGTFFPEAEKLVGLKKASIQLYIMVYKNRELVKEAKSLRDARTMITEKKARISGKEITRKPASKSSSEPTIRSASGEKPIKDMTPEESADMIVRAIQNIIEKMPEANRQPALAQLKDYIADLKVV